MDIKCTKLTYKKPQISYASTTRRFIFSSITLTYVHWSYNKPVKIHTESKEMRNGLPKSIRKCSNYGQLKEVWDYLLPVAYTCVKLSSLTSNVKSKGVTYLKIFFIVIVACLTLLLYAFLSGILYVSL